ncbi:hypothetical protein [Pseudanabaena sp. ABRG5-3]|uniref:hypothetical protein n=1 Tax=Pseudanabaena sp. ABRG5-3 TaxID=685565 RepID=UPI000DC72337|nr:hypothetical protein [Pseudanabaena sp. ABRG5-3]BBC25588.1 RNA polymerase, sigma-24 subunit, ECF subfamily [Pseudanabaena sp. ABRG5-3]
MFPQSFLIQTAYEHNLSPEQEEVLIHKFAHQQTYEQMSNALGISKEACIKRMGGVYEKFGIIGDTRGKENRLRIFLKQRYEHQRKYQHQSLVNNHFFNEYSIEDTKNVDGLTDKVEELLKALNQNITKPQVLITNPYSWLVSLKQKLNQDNSQEILQELSTKLPEAVQRLAATSRQTELEITKELLEKLAQFWEVKVT